MITYVRILLGYWRRVIFSRRHRRNRTITSRYKRLNQSPVPWNVRLERHAESLRSTISSLPPIALGTDCEDEIHLLCGHRHTPLGCFALWSLLRYVQFDVAVFVHDDGSLDDADRGLWESRFSNIVVVTPDQSRATRSKFFAAHDFPLLEQMSREHIYAKKLLDFHLVGPGKRIAMLDTDVLFFRQPDELLSVWDRLAAGVGIISTFDDIGSSYAADTRAIARAVGQIPERFNAGMCLLQKFGTTDFSEVERVLGLMANQQGDLLGHLWAEQTIYAIMAGRRTLHRMSPEYQIGGATGNPVAVHYAGLFRELFFTEGIPRL